MSIFDSHSNFAYSTVLTAPSPASSGTSLVVQAGDGTKFPTAPFNATVWPSGSQPTTTNAEIVRVTNISTDTFTITRAQESSSARTILVGDQIAATITAKTITDVEAIMTTIYPVGSIYTSTLSTNPNTLLGFGTWVAFAAGQVLVGKANGGTFGTGGATGGEETHTLTTSEMPSHNHTTVNGGAFKVSNSGWTSTGGLGSPYVNDPASITTGSTTATNQATGGGGPHNILQPYIVVYIWQRTA